MKRRAPIQGARSKKKQKDGIRRPLSAYNIYFKLVRPVLIETHDRGDKQPDFDTHLDSAMKTGKTKAQGAVFQAASRTLAERWKNMTPAERDPFERQAHEEMKKYKIQLVAFEMKKAAEEKTVADSKVGIKMKEAPKDAPAPAVAAADWGEASSSGTTTKGDRQQQFNLSDSENTTISSKSEPSSSQGKVVLQQTSGGFNLHHLNGEAASRVSVVSSTPNVIGASDVESVTRLSSSINNNNHSSSSQANPMDLFSRTIGMMLMSQLAAGGNNNNNMNMNNSANNSNILAEELIQRLATAALMQSLTSDPASLLLVLVLLLQANNQPPPPPRAPEPEPNAAALLMSLFQSTMKPNQAPPEQPQAPAQLLNGLNLFGSNMFQTPNQNAPTTTPSPEMSQASLIENLNRLTDGERDLLTKLIQGRLSQAQP